MVTLDRLPKALRAYMNVHGIEPGALLQDGRLALTFDGRWRVQVRPMPDGRLLILALVHDLGTLPEIRADEMLARLGHYASGVIRDHRSTLAMEEGGRRLMLQEVVPADLTLPQLEESLGDFLNVLAFWSRTSQMEAAGR
jgi:hypothetical protein